MIPVTDLHALVDQLPGVVLYRLLTGADNSRRCTYMSAGVERVLGVTPEAVIADPGVLDAMILDEDLARLVTLAQSARATLSPYAMEIRARTVAGDLRWLQCRAITHRGAGGGSIVADGILVDITEHKRAEEALRERETQLRNLCDNLPEGTIYQVVRRPDGSNYFPYISAGQAETYRLTREQVMADASLVYQLFVEEDLTRMRARADESLRTLTRGGRPGAPWPATSGECSRRQTPPCRGRYRH